ncbi:hypothetical protein ABIE88_003383 [Bradyrhizobium diazoefficiens]|jgi:hypothetical protein|uniref:hypothetical protein n=1 Tax=Bradyrhizobium diazoefficiens TaxID=1355477 RepID=UPI003512A39A
MTDATAAGPPALSITGITYRKIADQIVTAIEGGSGYWMTSFRPVEDIKTDVSPWYDDERIWAGNFNIEVTDDEEKVHFFTPESLKKGLQWLADNHLWRIEQIVKETGDAETADVFIQACVLGDIVYG